MTFRQMIFSSKTDKPVERFIELMAEVENWNHRVLEFQKEYHRLPAIIRDNITGAQYVAGMQDTGSNIEPYGWSKYREPYLEPRKGGSGDKARMRLGAIGTSPAVVKEMVEAFDIPPYYRTKSDVYYPGFDLLQVEESDDDFILYIIFNVWPGEDEEMWDGGEHFAPVLMWEYYQHKGF